MNPNIPRRKLNREFYTRDVLKVARDLLGKILVKEEDGIILSGKIVEVEAYDGDVDQASHTYIGKTKRNEIMFGEGGYFYVYFTYGAHFCCNVVTGREGHGTAVLIRGIEPLEGVETMIRNRFGRKLLKDREIFNLTSGPGKICSAFNITKKEYGLDLTAGSVYILDRPKVKKDNIIVAKRIGIKKSVDLPWRFYLKDNPFVSKK